MENKGKIFLNPKFRKFQNIHINPNFLTQSNSTIHYNPKFLVQNQIEQKPPPAEYQQPVIKNTRNKLIRAPSSITTKSEVPKTTELIKISKNKLVRASKLIERQNQHNQLIKSAIKNDVKIKKINAASKPSIYKFDRRYDEREKKVSRYSIKRLDSSNILLPKKVVIKNQKLLKIGRNLSTDAAFKPINSQNRKLVMLNINGVLYKSTNNKLQRSSSDNSERSLFVRGVRFTLDASGMELRKETGNSLKMSRIDIGGLTYKASNDGAFERDNSHQVRSHLSSSKQKSISILSNKLKKINIICPIFHRLGKCMAHSRGRCPKKHDRKYVAICPQYLKGKCSNENCLLSHDTALTKMPVCRFFLQGLCSKDDCLYLHKKLSDTTKICPEFLKGFCALADKCDLRHENPKDIHSKINRKVRRKEPKLQIQDKAGKVDLESLEKKRYFADEESGAANSSQQNVPKRMKLGCLPSYIPLS